ncbi:WD40 repeat domain-containing protein [Bernardetia sp.]|uniref:WD40 repeat domain-containing protein n=1 Tax=Bernardetia sp. TaxID=1937974 RepID=UPI0025C13891|nr:WD40 repeat domain-containing protein [Bernardetia sp.]
MKQTYPPIVFLTSTTEKSAFLAADASLSAPQRKGTCELIMASENIFSEVFQRLDEKEFSERLFIFHWVGDFNDSTFIEQLIRRLSTMPNLACLVLEDILVPPSATIAHLLPITIAISKNQDNDENAIFSSYFYEQLAQNNSIKEAYNYASRKLPNTTSTMFVKPSAEHTLDFTFLQTKKEEETPKTPEQEKIERFKKIISQKSRFSAFSKPELLLSEREIKLFEEYKFELAPLSDIENQLYHRSVKKLNQKKRQRRYLYRTIFFLTFFLMLAGLGFWLQHREYQRQAEAYKIQTRQQQANFLTYLGDNMQKEDATKAIRMIEKAVREYPTHAAQGALYSHFYTPSLYYSARVVIDTTDPSKNGDANHTVSSDGQWLAYFENGKEKSAIFIRSLQGDVIKKIERNIGVETITFSNSLPYRLAVGFASGKVEILDVYGKNLLEMQAHKDTISKISFSKDDTRLISAADTMALIWTTSGEVLDTISGNRSKILKMRFSPNQNTLFTESKDSVVAVWEGSSLLSTFEGTHAKWLSENYLLLKSIEKKSTERTLKKSEESSSENNLKWKVWDISNNKIKKELQNPKKIIPQDSTSFWVIDDKNTLTRHYFENDSVTLWQRDVAYFAMHKGVATNKWATISEKGLCTMHFSDGSEITTKLEDLPLKEPYFTQDGNYFITQMVDNITFWRAVSPQIRFSDKERGEKWIAENATPKMQSNAEKDVQLVYYSGNIYRLTDQNENAKAEFAADKVFLHPSQNYVLSIKNLVVTLDEFDKSNLAFKDRPFKIKNLFTTKSQYKNAGFAEQGSFIWAITEKNELHLLDLQGKIVHRQTVKPNTEVVCSQDDKHLGLAQNIAGSLKPYRIFHIETQQGYELDTRLERANITSLFFSPVQNGQPPYLVSASDFWTDFWDMKGRRMKALKGGNPIYGKEMILTSSEDNFYIATLGVDRVYHQKIENLQKAVLSPDKNYIILHFEDELQIWRTSPFGIIKWLEKNKIYQLSTQEEKQLLLR